MIDAFHIKSGHITHDALHWPIADRLIILSLEIYSFQRAISHKFCYSYGFLLENHRKHLYSDFRRILDYTLA